MITKNFFPVILLVMAWNGAAVPASAQDTPNYAITGVHTNVGTKRQGNAIGPRPARRNINDMQNDIPTWSLYIQALIRMKLVNEENYLSWFQIAGIHGRPYISWNNVNQCPDCQTSGYCTHGSVLFLTWHRPYLALFEQVLASHCQAIVATYPPDEVPIYQAAANNFRIPYWDWASNTTLPSVVNADTITITTPSGVQSVPNPLLNYTWQTFQERQSWFPTNQSESNEFLYDAYLAEYRQTVRGALTPGGPGNWVNSDQMMRQYPYMQMTYNALVKSTTFDNFSTTGAPGPSIEDPHNEVHVAVGGEGHMAYLSYAAFDPVFMLHHCNVDRIFALWQAMHPDPYLTSLKDDSGTFAIAPGTNETSSTLLYPFSQENEEWYTSDSCRSLTTFGYTYDEIDDWDQTPPQLQHNVTAQVTTLYNPNRQFINKRDSIPGQQTLDWSVDLRVDKFDCLGARFVIRLFLGAVPENLGWLTAPSCVGSFRIFPPPYNRPGPFPEVLTYSEVSLAKGLSDKGIDGEDVEATVEYLKENLVWIVQKSDGSFVPNEQLPSLRVTVQDEVVTMAGSITELPVYGKKTLHPEITKRKAGGYSG